MIPTRPWGGDRAQAAVPLDRARTQVRRARVREYLEASLNQAPPTWPQLLILAQFLCGCGVPEGCHDRSTVTGAEGERVLILYIH